MASKTASLSVEGVGGKTRDEDMDGGGAGSKVSSPASKQAERGDGGGDGAASERTEGKSSESGTVQEGKTSPMRDGVAGTGSTPAERSSRSSSDAAQPIVIEAGGRQSGPNLVQRFVDFVFRVIHTEMDSFFTEHADKFDQDWEDFNQQGETLEQFQEGFDNAPECFMELERLVTEDAEEHKRRMAEMQENLRRQQEEYNAAMKSNDGDSSAPTPKQPLMIFFQPISLEQLMQMVLNMAEYPTFSFMMRMKVQQIKLMKAIREQMEAARRDSQMVVEDIELADERVNNDEDFATTTAAMDSAGGKTSPESNRK
eukprot:g1655.t1